MTFASAGFWLMLLLPPLVWGWVYYRRDRWEPEPAHMLLRLYVAGALVAAPVWFLEAWIPNPFSGLAAGLFDALVRVALVEEGMKLWAVWRYAYSHDELDEPMDGIVYGVCVGLGFATVENALYGFVHGPGVLLMRGFTSMLAHAGFTGLLGYRLGLRKCGKVSAFAVARTFLLMVVLHGAFDFMLAWRGDPTWLPKLAIVIVLPPLLALVAYAVRLAERQSPFRPEGASD